MVVSVGTPRLGCQICDLFFSALLGTCEGGVSALTKAQVEKIVRVWQGRLGLERWKIEVEFSNNPADFYAEANPSVQYESCTLVFSPGWSELTVELVDQTVVHELLHLLHRDVDTAVEAARSQLHPQASGQIEKRYEHAMEGFIDRLATRLVELAS